MKFFLFDILLKKENIYMLEVGTKAMHFQLYDDKHNLVSLDMFKGKKIVLVFLPQRQYIWL